MDNVSSVEPTTIAGVIVLTTFVVSQLKMALHSTPYVRRVPVFVVSTVVALFLCLLCKWAGYLEGDVWKLLAQTMIAAFGSGGLYGVWSGSAVQSLNEAGLKPSKPNDKPLLRDYPPLRAIAMIALLLPLSGCNFMQSYKNSTPIGKVALAKQDFTTLLNTLADLRDDGFLTQAQLDKTKPAALTAKLALDEWQYDVDHNLPTKDAESKFEAAAVIIRRLRDSLRPTTQPSTQRSMTHATSSITYVDRNRGGYCRQRSARGT